VGAAAARYKKIVALVASVMLAGFAPRASLAQLRGVSNDEPVFTDTRASAANALQQWEAVLAARITDGDTWTEIGQRLYSAGCYRESIAAFEQSIVRRHGHAPEAAQFIAAAYAKLGNVKQASRWRAEAGPRVALPTRGGGHPTV
jgi:predicted Zn-dependent protease